MRDCTPFGENSGPQQHGIIDGCNYGFERNRIIECFRRVMLAKGFATVHFKTKVKAVRCKAFFKFAARRFIVLILLQPFQSKRMDFHSFLVYFYAFRKIGKVIMVARIGASQIICTAIHGDLAARTLHIAVAVCRLDHITAMIAADCITNNFPHGYSSLGEYEKILNPKIEDLWWSVLDSNQ